MDQPDQESPALPADKDREVIPPATPSRPEASGVPAEEAQVPPAQAQRRGGARGSHRAKVSWVGRSDNAHPASRKSWLGRLAHVVTADPVDRGPGPAAGNGPPRSPATPRAARAEAGSGPVRADIDGDDAGVDEAIAISGGRSDDATRIAVTKADPRDEVVFVRAAPVAGHEGSEATSSAGASGGEAGGPEPVFPVAPRRNPIIATATGAGVGLVALLCFYAGPPVALALTSILLAVAMLECYRSLQRAGYRPASVLGLVAAPGAAVAAYFEGAAGIALVAAFIVLASFCWYLAGVTRRSPVVNLGATVFGWGWVGLLGSFAGLLLDPAAFPHRTGLALLLGGVEATVAYDVGGYLFGSWLGKRPMLPRVSPKKTWEGLIGGCLAAFVVSVALVSQMSPWSYGRGALLGLVVVVLAPLGDLGESMVKRDLGLKDMGTLLPAHGGALDRVDGLLFVLPATYLLVRLLGW